MTTSSHCPFHFCSVLRFGLTMNNRNSWAAIYKENTALRKNIRLFGQEIETDDGLEMRVTWSQRGAGVSCFLGTICWAVGQRFAAMLLAAVTLLSLCILYFKNFSFVIAKRLLREMNVIFILGLGLCNCIVNIARPKSSLEPILGVFFVLLVFGLIFVDAVKVKSRLFVIAIGSTFAFFNLYNIYTRTFGGADQGVVLLKYTMHGNEYTFMKRSTKRSIYIQIVLFSINGIYTIFKDRTQELMIFATGNIYREARHDTETDDRLEARVKWAQPAIGLSFLLTVICFIAVTTSFAALPFCILGVIFTAIMSYKNISFDIMKKLMQETNVIIILVLSLCNWVIDIVLPAQAISPILGLMYMLAICIFVFLDAVKVKHRMFVIVIGVLFIVLNINNIYHLIFGNWNQGVVLLKYTISGNEYTIMKRATQRSIFIQIVLFSTSGIYTLLNDKKQKLLIFATGNIYRETGTASKEVEEKSFVREIKLENVVI